MAKSKVKKVDDREIDHWITTKNGKHLPVDKDGKIIIKSEESKKSSKGKQELTSKQNELLNKLDNMEEESDIISIGGYDYQAVQEAADEGEEWAEELLDGAEFPDSYLKVGKNQWSPATFEDYPPVFNREEMIKKIKSAKPLISSKRELKKYYKEVFE